MIRTDLALELTENSSDSEGIISSEKRLGGVIVTEIEIVTDSAAQRLGKQKGKYITLTLDSISAALTDSDTESAVFDAVAKLLPQGTILFAGLGNRGITPDALGPATADLILATRHIDGELSKSLGLEGLQRVAVISPNVLGNTGIEAAETVSAAVEITEPAAVVVVDALAARSIDRLGKTIQISNTGISPGAGVGNRRREMSENTLGVPVISIGIPTVVDLSTLIFDLCGRDTDKQEIVTPKDIDLIISRGAKLLARSLNRVFQPNIPIEDIEELI